MQRVLDFTVADLLAGGDDVVALSTATNDPDGLWGEVARWPRPRLTAALVAAVGVIQGEREPAGAANGHGGQVATDRDRTVTTGGRVPGHVAARPSVDGH